VTVSFDYKRGTSFQPNLNMFETSVAKLFSNSLETLDRIKRLLDVANSSEFAA